MFSLEIALHKMNLYPSKNVYSNLAKTKLLKACDDFCDHGHASGLVVIAREITPRLKRT